MRILENAKVVMCLSYSFKIMLNYISCIYLEVFGATGEK